MDNIGSALSIQLGDAFTQTLGVFATAALVNSNKFILMRINFPAKATALTCAHNTLTFICVRLSGSCTGVSARDVHWSWFLFNTCVGSLSVLASNILLQIASVTFHQVSKLAALPLGAALDFFLYEKRRSPGDFVGLMSIAYAICVTSRTQYLRASTLLELLLYSLVVSC